MTGMNVSSQRGCNVDGEQLISINRKSPPITAGIFITPRAVAYFAAGFCMATILPSASAQASAMRAFGDVEPGGVAKPVCLM